MDQSKVKKRVVRVIFGLMCAVVFAIFAYVSCKVAVHSDECLTEDTGIYEDSIYGVHRQDFLARQPKLKEKEKEPETQYVTQSAPAQNQAQSQTEEQPLFSEAEPELSPAAIKAQSLGLPAPPEIDINEWQYMLVNTKHTLSSDYAPSLAYLNQTMDETDIQYEKNDYRCPIDERIAQALVDFTKACKDAGAPVFLSSGYRSYSEQNYLFERKVSQGYTEEVAKTIVAYPGTSEHQTGLCCDITDRYRELKDSSLADTDTFKWLYQNCADYGFILRYPEDKSGSADSITGCIYEPWHFRYVGVEAAKYIMENNLCLEEFWSLYE